jgi:hypothetical protein
VLTRSNSGNNNSDRMGNPLAQLGSLPDHLECAIQNDVGGSAFRACTSAPNMDADISKAMHTWSLFTELAGAQGLYCDRVSYAVMALLVDSRRAQTSMTGRNDLYINV